MRRYSLHLVVLSASVASMWGQYVDLAVNQDGSVAYFATPMRQAQTDQPFYGKLFRVADGAAVLQEHREIVPPAPFNPSFGGFGVSNKYNINGVSISADGGTTAVMARAECYGDIILCAKSVELTQTTIRTGSVSKTLDGALRLSLNGEWAFGSSSLYSTMPQQTAYLVNVRGGSSKRLLITNGAARVQISWFRPISDTGVAVYCDGDSVVAMQNDESRHIYLESRARPSDASVNASGSSVVFSAADPAMNTSGLPVSFQSIYVAPVAGGSPKLVASDGDHPVFGSDGVTIFFYRGQGANRQLWSVAPSGEIRQVTRLPSGMLYAKVSGDDRRAFAYTYDGRMVRVDVTTGEATDILPPVPALDPGASTSRSKLTVFRGTGLLSCDPSTVVVGGRPVRVTVVSDTAISVLVPPDIAVTANGGTTIEFKAGARTPFVPPPVVATVRDSYPEFFRDQSQMAVAAHQNWEASVSLDNPARPGEVVHLFGSGFGPTVPVVPFGEVTPVREPLPVLAVPYACFAQPGNFPLRIPYQGLAPGMIGVYQFDIHIPADWSDGLLRLICSGDGSGYGGLITYIPIQ